MRQILLARLLKSESAKEKLQQFRESFKCAECNDLRPRCPECKPRDTEVSSDQTGAGIVMYDWLGHIVRPRRCLLPYLRTAKVSTCPRKKQLSKRFIAFPTMPIIRISPTRSLF